MNEMNATSRTCCRKFPICVAVSETQAWFTVKIRFAVVIQLNLVVQMPDLGA